MNEMRSILFIGPDRGAARPVRHEREKKCRSESKLSSGIFFSLVVLIFNYYLSHNTGCR